jgi:phage tail-like protein
MADAIVQRTDPLRNFKFRVAILPIGETLDSYLNGVGEIGFAQVGDLSVTNDIISYREGGMNTHPHKMVGQSDFAPVSFTRGAFAKQDQLWKWQKFMHAWLGGGVTGGQGLANTDDNYRCNIVVKVYDHPHTASGQVTNGDGQLRYAYDGGTLSNSTNGNVVPGKVMLQYKLYNCWPGAFALTGLNAGDNGIMIQQLTVHHEGFYISWDGSDITD